MFQLRRVRPQHHATDDLRWFPPGGSGRLPGSKQLLGTITQLNLAAFKPGCAFAGGQRGSFGALEFLSVAPGWSGELGGRLRQRETAGRLLQRGRDAKLDSYRHGGTERTSPKTADDHILKHFHACSPDKSMSFPPWTSSLPEVELNKEPKHILIKKAFTDLLTQRYTPTHTSAISCQGTFI